MNDLEYRKLLETSWRRPLTPEEQARLDQFLAEAPAARADWETETALSGVLDRLPEPPVASNFTAQVMRAIESERARPSRPATAWPDWLGALWPKMAWAAVALLLAVGVFQGYGVLNRARMARDLANIPVVPTVPPADILQDFDAIQQLSQVPAASSSGQTISDEALLAALQ
jgi:anti-sigma factor RsiW